MGVYLSIVGGLLKLANYVAGALRQHHDEMNGRLQQKVESQDATLKKLGEVAAPVSSAESDRLWRENKARFGATDGER